ncbi:MAG: pyridoxal phosphate-dependent aminotransferase, partial [Planctomycetes bacterium]|nr:pyridoxal phosphate-dependent aminotransferase [Planctomycetota bacterium]
THYPPVPGTVALRQAIIDRVARDCGGYEAELSQVLVSAGAKHTLYNLFQVLLDPGDEVVLPSPYWVSYPEMVNLVGATGKIIQTSQQDDYKLTPELLRKAITPKSALLILNYPSNPGGFTYSPAELKALGAVIEESNLAVLSDEIYEKLIYGGAEFQSFAAANPQLYDRTITVNGLSKSFSMTGWRVGFIAAPLDAAAAIGKMQSHTTSGPATFCQIASVEALRNGHAAVKKMAGEFAKRAKHIHQRLNALPDVTCMEPTGAFYVFPNVSATYAKLQVKGSVEFCQRLLEEAKVAAVPGIGFGCDDNIRLSFATSMEQIDKGLDRIEEFLKPCR